MGHAYPCAVLEHAMLRYGVGGVVVGVGVMRISGRRFVALLARRVFGIGDCGAGVGVGGAFVGVDLYCCMFTCRWYDWYQCGIKVGLCAGRVGAMPLLVLWHGGQGVKRGLLGLQKLQLKKLPCCANWSREWHVCVCARVRGTVWCVVSGLLGVLISPLIV